MEDSMKPNVNKDQLWKMVMAFQVSKAVFVASELDVFTMLSKKPSSGEDIAKKLKLRPRPVMRLLHGMVSFGLLKKRNDKFSNTEIASTFLVKGRPEYFGDYLSIINDVFTTWANYEKVIKENHSLPLFKKEDAKGAETARVIGQNPPALVRRVMLAQEQFSYRQAAWLPHIYDFSKHKLLLDVGGGTGIFSIMATKANAHLKAIVFDVPQVCTVAREQIKFYKAAKKVKVMEGDFLADELPTGSDVAILSTVLDGYDEPECRRLITKVFHALKPNGIIIANEMVLNDERTGPLFPAIFSLELMVERNTGDSRTVGEMRQWMKDAGFVNIASKPLRVPGETYLNCKIVVGQKPR
jgi:precorrin-6B methylase 2